jgi:hypothetical protein
MKTGNNTFISISNKKYGEQDFNLINDLTQNKKICLDAVSDNSIYLFGFGIHNNTNNAYACNQNYYANDQFWFHNSSITHKMFDFYDNIINIIIDRFKKNKVIINTSTENLFYTYLENTNIELCKTDICGIFVREYLHEQIV